MDVCEDCGERSVSNEEENGQTVRVCLECGHMPKQIENFTSDREFVVSVLVFGLVHLNVVLHRKPCICDNF